MEEKSQTYYPAYFVSETPNPFPSGPNPISEAACSFSSRACIDYRNGNSLMYLVADPIRLVTITNKPPFLPDTGRF